MSEGPESAPDPLVFRLGCGALAMFFGGALAVEGLRLLSNFNPEGILCVIFGVGFFCYPFKELLDL